MDPIPTTIPPETGPSADVVFPESDGVADTEGPVLCPWCSQRFGIALDPGGGVEQEYVEDCEACCRPIQLRVTWAASGRARVEAERTE